MDFLKYGVRIKNIQAGSLYDYNKGVRDNYDSKDAILPNSLFLDFLIENGLNIHNSKSTRDVICLQFDYGSRSYEEEIDHLKSLISRTEKDPELKAEYKQNKLKRLDNLAENANVNKEKYDKKSKQEIRTLYYTQGVEINYTDRKKNGTIYKQEKIKYRMLYRTPGKAKKGSCMFIREELYDKTLDFIRMGIKLPYEKSPIVEMGAYQSLITSAVVDRIVINPRNILVLNDVDSAFKRNVISVETQNGQCIARQEDGYQLKNTLFDGQALIDHSLFPKWGEGYILLRHHMCKMAALDSNIQLFFKDYFGDQYETAQVTDMWGNKHYAKDIELITTDNALKWLKFNVSYDYWCEKVEENGCKFGIVKTAHKSKLGEVQRMSYQMINSLNLDTMDKVVQKSVEYIEALKKDDNVFLKYLRDNANFSNDFDVLVALCEHNPEFVKSTYFRERKKKIIKVHVMNLQTGKVIENGDNLVIIGSPYAMLLHSVGEDVNQDDTFESEPGTIQCYTERFEDGEYLAEFRSPFNSKNNMGYLHNKYHPKLKKYFNSGKQMILVNMINTDFQDRNNGSDQDSDSIYTTNQPEIVSYAKYCYENYPTIVNNIPKEKNNYNNTLENYALIDNNLASAQLAIGESSNLAQLCLTYTYNFSDKKYEDYACILSVLAQVAIDNAKRRFEIDLTKEIKRIKVDMDIKEHKYPRFWLSIRKDFNKKAEDIRTDLYELVEQGTIPEYFLEEDMTREEMINTLNEKYIQKNKINNNLQCPMNFIGDIKLGKFRLSGNSIPMNEFLVQHPLENDRRKSRKVEELIQKYSFNLYNNWQVDVRNDNDGDEHGENMLLLQDNFDLLVEDIKKVYISKNYMGLMSWLINRAFMITPGVKRNQKSITSKLNNNRAILIKALYMVNPSAFLQCFKENLYT